MTDKKDKDNEEEYYEPYGIAKNWGFGDFPPHKPPVIKRQEESNDDIETDTPQDD